MQPLLQHLVEITAHRDHSLLEVSVVAAVNQLAGIAQVRLLEIFYVKEQAFVRPKAWIQDGKALAIDDAQPDQQKDPISNYPALMACIEQRQQTVQAMMPSGSYLIWLPIWLNDKVIACMEVGNPVSLGAQTLQVIEGILHVYRNYLSLLDYSERDSLTGLLNRKTFDEKFSKAALGVPSADSDTAPNNTERRQGGAETGQWLAVVDIDHFKRVNDEFGHLYGDEVLILVSNLLKSSFRSQDRIFRFGGEEFVILLRGSTLDNARKVLDRFREKVESHHFPQVGRITVSLGFVGITGDSSVVILGHADQALYYAKNQGRNQVCYYDDLINAGLLESKVSRSEVEFF